MPDSPFGNFQQKQSPSPPKAGEMRPALLVVLSESAKYLKARGNDPAMVALVTTLMGQLELTLQALYAHGIEVPILIQNPNARDNG